MSFNDNDNWQIDPFIGTLSFVPRVETHTVRQYSNYGNRFGVQVDYNILFTNPSTVSIPGYTEVGFGVSPSINQFRVDYDNLRQDGTVIETIKYKNTAFIEFNAGANGASVTVAYRGTGRIVTGKNLANFIADQTIPGGLEIDGNFALGDGSTGSGNLTMTGTIEGTLTGALVIKPNAGTIENLEEPTNSSDAATKNYVDSRGAAGTNGIVSGTLANRTTAGTTTTNVTLPSTGNWLVFVNATFQNGDAGVESTININTVPVVGLLSDGVGTFGTRTRYSGHRYLTSVSTLTFAVINVSSSNQITDISYFAIRIS